MRHVFTSLMLMTMVVSGWISAPWQGEAQGIQSVLTAGTVTAVNVQDKTLLVRTIKQEDLTFTLDVGARITRGHAVLSLEELVPGSDVTIQYVPDGPKRFVQSVTVVDEGTKPPMSIHDMKLDVDKLPPL